MSCFLKQSTAVDIAIGPLLDSADGNTIEGSLTITQPDIRLKKNGGAWAQKSAAQTLSHEENGWYEVALSTTDTDTLGILIVAIHESGALPVWRELSVVPANVYDSLFSTDLLQVDFTQLLGGTPNALVSGRVDASVGAIAANVITAAATNADFLAEVNAEVDTALADYDAPTFAELDARTDAIEADTQDIQARLPAALVSGRIDSSVGVVAANAITDAAVATDMDSYQAKVGLLDDDTGTADRYEVAWFKNGNWITSGITSPTVRVVKSSDGSNLFAAAAMTEIGSLHLFKKTEATNRVVRGATYWAIAEATIDGSTRSWPQVVGRDDV